MAVTTQYSTEYQDAYVDVPADKLSTDVNHGKMRMAFFTCNQSGVGDATSSFALCKLPAGTVKVLLGLSGAYVNWTTASHTLDLGWDAYTGQDGVAVVADPDGLVDGLDVDAVGFRSFWGNATGALNTNFTPAAIDATGATKTFSSQGGVVIRATSQDVAMVDGDDLVGWICYVID